MEMDLARGLHPSLLRASRELTMPVFDAKMSTEQDAEKAGIPHA
jgi:hypothetical protein